jgi:transposase-like protein
MGTNRRHFSDEFKAKVVRRHLADKVPVSDLAAEHEIQPSMIHLWVKQVLDQAEKAFERCKGPKRLQMVDHADKRRIALLEAKLANKNEVIAELMEENVKSKKANGEL